MEIISWNIDSLNAALTSDSNRAIMSRDVLKMIKERNPDVIALQETKLSDKGPTKKHLEILDEIFPGYQLAWRSSQEPARKGYAGVMFLYKEEFDFKVSYPNIGAPDTLDAEGRILTLEMEDCYLTQVYTPNAGSELKRLELRQEWDKLYTSYLNKLDMDKPVIAMGDYNVAHKEIDLANPSRNHNSAGFTPEERTNFTFLLENGYTDTFRHIHGEVEGHYTWWNQRAKTSKINNSGWRIDYFLVSDRLADRVEDMCIFDSGKRQDHTPLGLKIKL